MTYAQNWHLCVLATALIALVVPTEALFPYLGGLYPGQDGFSPPKWASANLDKGLDTAVIVGPPIGDATLSQLRKYGRSVSAPGAGVIAVALGSSGVVNFTDINSGKFVSAAKIALAPSFSISALFSPQNSSVVCVLASSSNNTDRYLQFFTIAKPTEKSPVILKFPDLALPEGIEQSPTVTGYLGTDVLVATVGGSVLMWYLDDLTALPKKLFSITAAYPLGMDAIAAVTTDPKIMTTKTVVVWDYSLTSSIYIIDLSSPSTSLQIDLRKYCGGDSNFAASPRRAFFDAIYQRFYVVIDSCRASGAPMLVWVETTTYPPTIESSTPKELGPLAREVSNFQWLFQQN